MQSLKRLRPSSETRRKVDEPLRQEHLSQTRRHLDVEYDFVDAAMREAMYEFAETGRISKEIKDVLQEEDVKAYVNYKNLYFEVLYLGATLCMFKSHITRDRYLLEIENEGECTKLLNLKTDPWNWAGEDDGD